MGYAKQGIWSVVDFSGQHMFLKGMIGMIGLGLESGMVRAAAWVRRIMSFFLSSLEPTEAGGVGPHQIQNTE